MKFGNRNEVMLIILADVTVVLVRMVNYEQNFAKLMRSIKDQTQPQCVVNLAQFINSSRLGWQVMENANVAGLIKVNQQSIIES